MGKTWEDCAKDAVCTVYYDWQEDGYRVMVLRGPCSVNAYVGVPENHPAYGKPYDDVYVRCHGGLTFAQAGNNNTIYPEGWWWLGWDYAHYGDECFFDVEHRNYENIP